MLAYITICGILKDFLAAQVYNKPSLGIVPLPYNPFKEYKLAQLPETRKRNLTVEQMLKIKNLQLKPNSRTELSAISSCCLFTCVA